MKVARKPIFVRDDAIRVRDSAVFIDVWTFRHRVMVEVTVGGQTIVEKQLTVREFAELLSQRP